MLYNRSEFNKHDTHWYSCCNAINDNNHIWIYFSIVSKQKADRSRTIEGIFQIDLYFRTYEWNILYFHMSVPTLDQDWSCSTNLSIQLFKNTFHFTFQTYPSDQEIQEIRNTGKYKNIYFSSRLFILSIITCIAKLAHQC